jgi:lipoprotein-anchoring transpeptidase ErfK/SrfK
MPKLARSTRIAVLLTAALALLLSACSSSSGGGPGDTTTKTVTGSQSASAPATASSSAPASSTAPAKPATVVHVTALESDGETYGIGMPIVLYFKPVPKDVKAFTAAVKVTVNGQPANGAWYWEQPTSDEVKAKVVEAHYRMRTYWPADSKIHVSTPLGGVSAGPNMVFSNKLTSLDYNIGDSHISTVDAHTLKMHVTSNGKLIKTIPVSLGAAATPTYNGVKVVMQKGEDLPGTDKLRPNGTVMMNGPGYRNDPVQWSVRITQSGEYVHAAPWNGEIGARSTSNGCTNLHTSDGKWFYQFARIGDVVTYSGTDGTEMRSDDGLGDWNVNWGAWQLGGMFA